MPITAVQTKIVSRYVKDSTNAQNAKKSSRTNEEVQKITNVVKSCVSTVKNMWIPTRTSVT